MRKLILYIHKISYGSNEKHKYKYNNKVLWLVCNVLSRVCDVSMNLYLKLYAFLGFYPSKLRGRDDIVVSLTSYPGRIKNVWMVIDSIFNQKVQPGLICLYLMKDEFPNGESSLPKRLLHYKKIGLKICFREINLKPHNKYFFALQEFKDRNVITVDDDLYYHDDLISNLLKIHQEHPNCVCSNKIKEIRSSQNSKFLPYSQWSTTPNSIPSQRNLALGYAGVLYPAGVFNNNKSVFTVEKIKLLALKADDLWLKIQERLANIKVASGSYYSVGPNILGTQIISLQSTNCSGGNDKQWRSLCEYYKLDSSDFAS